MILKPNTTFALAILTLKSPNFLSMNKSQQAFHFNFWKKCLEQKPKHKSPGHHYLIIVSYFVDQSASSFLTLDTPILTLARITPCVDIDILISCSVSRISLPFVSHTGFMKIDGSGKLINYLVKWNTSVLIANYLSIIIYELVFNLSSTWDVKVFE